MVKLSVASPFGRTESSPPPIPLPEAINCGGSTTFLLLPSEALMTARSVLPPWATSRLLSQLNISEPSALDDQHSQS